MNIVYYFSTVSPRFATIACLSTMQGKNKGLPGDRIKKTKSDTDGFNSEWDLRWLSCHPKSLGKKDPALDLLCHWHMPSSLESRAYRIKS